jgi:hypothetical protein
MLATSFLLGYTDPCQKMLKLPLAAMVSDKKANQKFIIWQK